MARTKNSEIYNHEGYTDPTAYFGMMENQTRGVQNTARSPETYGAAKSIT